MNFLFPENITPTDQRQNRLIQLAALFLLLYSVVLTVSPAARMHSWAVEYRWNHWIGFAVWLVGVVWLHGQIMRLLPERDPFLFPVVALLAGWGLLEIWRLDALNGLRQTLWLIVSLLVFWVGLRAPNLLGWLRRYKYIWLTGGLLITALTFFFGTYPGGVGPHLWLGCCGLYFQPSEPLKLLLIIYLAAYLADQLPITFHFSALIAPTLVLMGGALLLLVGQRDLGTASLFVLIYTLVTYMASGRRRVLLMSALTLVAAAVGGYLLFDVVRVRVDSWINPWLDSNGRSFQIVQSLLAFANGEILGRGPGLGNPGVVPVAHSDFIFASIGEETGLLGIIGMLILYALLLTRGFRVALFATNHYKRYLAAGLSIYLTLQTILITGGNLRLLPLTGVTLPFVSYGGSSLLTAFISALLILLISNHEEEEPAPLAYPRPYLLVSAGLLAGLAAVALMAGWWAGWRSDDLLARADNPRLAIDDRYVQRGALTDRNNLLIASSKGLSGSYQRIYDYPLLSNTSGYVSTQYGLAGLESALDPYLRGLKGSPASLIWWNRMIYGQPPPGLNVRLTIDLNLQRRADGLLKGHTGAVVLLNSQTGEILTISSAPTFDPAKIDETWATLTKDPYAPLLNRATQGQYPPGTALTGFLYMQTAAMRTLPPVPQTTDVTLKGRAYTCTVPPAAPATWISLVTSGCPTAAEALGMPLGAEGLQNLFRSLGLLQTPQIMIETANASTKSVAEVDLAAAGQDTLTVTPLQMALAAAALTQDGMRPAPQIASSVQTPAQGWIMLPADTSATSTAWAGKTNAVILDLRHESDPYWQTVGSAVTQNRKLTWLLAGTLPTHPGMPLTLAVLLEEDNPALAEQISQTLMQPEK